MKPLTKPTLILVRHGDTAITDANRLPGWDDDELGPDGHEQAKQAAQKIVKLGAPLHHIYTGSLMRTKQTGKHIADATGVDTTRADGLNPWDYGDMTGKEKSSANLKNLKFFQRRPNIAVPGGGESYNDFLDRWGTTLNKAKDYVTQNPDKALVLVTHSRNHYALDHLLGNQALKDIPTKDERFGPGTVHKLEFEPDGKYSLTKL